MPDWIISRIPIPTENRVSAATAAGAARKAGHAFAPDIPEGMSSFTVYVMEIVSEPEEFPIQVTATTSRDVSVLDVPTTKPAPAPNIGPAPTEPTPT